MLNCVVFVVLSIVNLECYISCNYKNSSHWVRCSTKYKKNEVINCHYTITQYSFASVEENGFYAADVFTVCCAVLLMTSVM